MAAAVFTLASGLAPTTPTAGFVRVYSKTDKKLYLKDDAGLETPLITPGAQTVSDTDSVNLTLTGVDLTADVRFADATIDSNASGIKVATGGIANAQVAAGAAIAYSKLNLATSLVNSDVAPGAAIAYSKLNLASSIVNADVAAGAAIVYSKLNLSLSVVNADIAAGAAISFSKLAASGAPAEQYGKIQAGDTLDQALAKLSWTQALINDTVSVDATVPTGHTWLRTDISLTGTATITLPSGSSLRII